MKNPILNEIKNLVADRDITLTKLAKKMGERLGRKYSLASLSQKLRNGTISYREIMLIAEILNYKIIFYDLNEKKFKINSWLLLFVKWPTTKHFFHISQYRQNLYYFSAHSVIFGQQLEGMSWIIGACIVFISLQFAIANLHSTRLFAHTGWVRYAHTAPSPKSAKKKLLWKKLPWNLLQFLV